MTVEATMLAPGTQTADAVLPKISGYELLREKGRGPKAVVYKARRVFENDIVALKLFHRGISDRAMAAKIEAGVEKTTALSHAGLIRALGFGTDGGRSFMVMEYASGESLANFLFRQQQFPPAKALSVILYCAQTLKFAAEKGFHHGRLHPGRIILGRNTVRIAGVGMGERPEHAAWSVQFPHLFEPLVYTPSEAMPEKPFPETQAEAVDVYALGAILFHLLTCLPPYKGNDEGSLQNERGLLKQPVDWPKGARAAFSPELAALVESMLDQDPAKRPNYERLIPSLSELQVAAQKSGATGWHHGDADSANGLEGAGSISGFTSSGPIQGGATVLTPPRPTSSVGVPTVPLVQARGESEQAGSPHHNQHSATRQVSRRMAPARVRRLALDVVFSTLLFCMTVLVFLAVAYLTAQPYLPANMRLKLAAPVATNETNGKNGTAAAGTAALPPKPQDAGTQANAAPPEPVNLEEAALALRQLDKVQEMLRNGEIVTSPGLARVLRGISDRAGRATPTGIRALILAGEIESKIAPGKAMEPLPAPAPVPAAPTPAPAAPTPAPAPVPAAPAPAPDKPKPIPGVASVVRQTRKELKYFGYVRAKDLLEQFAVKGDSEQKRIAADYKTLVNYEEGLYERTRANLLDHIKKDPKHESQLQVFPRKDDPTGDDIIDFDEKGLHILVRGGANQGVKITPWDKFPAAQLLNLLLPLSNKASLEDQLGLAVFAFNRGLAPEAEENLGKAEKLGPDGKEKAGQFADTFAKITRALEAPE